MKRQILWVPPDYGSDLLEELRLSGAQIHAQAPGLLMIESLQTEFVWPDAQALDAEIVTFQSIRQAQSLLKERQKLWTASPASHFRRSELIQQGLRTVPERRRRFQEKMPTGPLGVFCLTGEHEMWISPNLQPAIPPRTWQFEESSEAPSRAYLKLWELFTREGFAPKKGDRCLELGSAPGGWTWVISELGAQVTAVDKGEMDSKILARPGVVWKKQDAFSVTPQNFEAVDWFFSDLICYPPKLLELVKLWAESGKVRNFVCTLKFQGPTDFQSIADFLRLPGSKIRHLHHNKHEVTWWWRVPLDR